MLTHHSAADYNVAASEAAKEARGKFEAEIERAKQLIFRSDEAQTKN